MVLSKCQRLVWVDNKILICNPHLWVTREAQASTEKLGGWIRTRVIWFLRRKFCSSSGSCIKQECNCHIFNLVAAEDRNFEKRIGQNETTSLQRNFIILLERHTKERKKCSDLFFLESEWLKQVKANFSRELFWLLCSEQSNRKTAIRRLLQNGKLFINQLVHSLANRSGNRNNQLASVK